MEPGTDAVKPFTNWFEKLVPGERRKAQRQETLPLVAYYWDGASPRAHPVRNISSAGFYLLTEQRWFPGTLVTMTLQRTDTGDSSPGRSIAVQSRVIRSDADGVGLAFVLPTTRSGTEESRRVQSLVMNGAADRKTLDQFLQMLRASKGQALIEYILVLPLLFLLVVNVVNFGGFFFAWITVANAARAGADYAILGGAGSASLDSLPMATAAQVTAMITQDISSLPNQASLAVNICRNNNGTITTLAGSCSSMPSDPEATSFILTSIDVTYTYVPFIPAGFRFPNLNIYATIPPTTIHRRAVMRTII
jgi:Flp pilus assembly protein TadG